MVEMVEQLGFLDVNLDDIPDLVNATPGQHELRIIGKPRYKSDVSDKGPWAVLNIALEVLDQENVQRIYHGLFLPQEGQEKNRVDATRRRIRDFCLAFGIPFGGGRLDFNDFVGKTGFANLDIESDPEYGEKAVIRSVVIPK